MTTTTKSPVKTCTCRREDCSHLISRIRVTDAERWVRSALRMVERPGAFASTPERAAAYLADAERELAAARAACADHGWYRVEAA